ncbi:helix-turn-helix domain-containing protein [Desulfoferrobacter suflitae]|uniref:helix-turn-helix domain-containing protein n=1 Tax=Desulfoferrobacter suflitae TaxID=2865782 RepID=UPI002164E7B5|nr:helix-turn-helix domain-containing protein [Desulfoferrobacter suflitae]MCK8600501.1 helix-turn-helix domain-containing protein [Desulfoferrobacter suflitae]
MKEFYLIQQVAEIFGVSESTIKRLIRDETLGAIKVRGCTRIPLQDIEKLKKRKKAGPQGSRRFSPDLRRHGPRD